MEFYGEFPPEDPMDDLSRFLSRILPKGGKLSGGGPLVPSTASLAPSSKFSNGGSKRRPLAVSVKSKKKPATSSRSDNSGITIGTVNVNMATSDRQPVSMAQLAVPEMFQVPAHRPAYLRQQFCNLWDIADGVFGTVLQGTHTKSCQTYAIKVIPSLDENCKYNNHFELATKIMQLSMTPHPRSLHIVNVLDCWYETVDNTSSPLTSYPFDLNVDDDIRNDIKSFFFAAMEFCTAENLQVWLDHRQKLPRIGVDVKLKINIADGLEYLHAAGIVLGNLNPSNILLTRNEGGAVIAKVGGYIFDRRSREMCQDSERDMEKYYQSPEMLSPIKPSDIYSLGVILFAFNIPWRNSDGRLSMNVFQQLENFRRGKFPENYPGSEFHKEFLRSMIRRDPKDRPSIWQVRQFIVSDVPTQQEKN